MASQDRMEGRALALLRSQASPDLPATDRAELFDLLLDIAATADLARSTTFAEVLEAVSPRNKFVDLAVELYASCLALRNRDTTLAVSLADAGRKTSVSLGWEAEAACFCLVLGNVQHVQGNYDQARLHFEEAVVAARRAEAKSIESMATMNLGLAFKNTGDLESAERVLRSAHTIAGALDNPANLARCESSLTTVLFRRSKWTEVVILARNAASQFMTLGLEGLANTTHLAEARALRHLGEVATARARITPALEVAKRLGRARNEILALEFLGDCDLDLGDPHSSRERYREALLLARGHGKATDLVLECLRGLAAAELACGEATTARSLIEESIAIARQQGDTFELGTSLFVQANVLNALGETSGEVAALEEARQIGSTIGDDHGNARASAALARHALAEGRRVDAMTLAAEAHRLFQRIGAEHLIAEASELLAEISAAPTAPVAPTVRARSPRAAARPNEPLDSIIPGFITVDPSTKQTLGIVRSLAPRKLNILVLGESGTGKELVAQAVHAQSGRTGPFVPVNCSAFPGDLIEGELFGHARGAYTGADRERAGLFEYAHQGTLFLDEIGDMPFKAQARLLRALEGGEVRRLGENTARVVDVRVVAATHRGLRTMVGAGEFRLDLYHRLAGYVVQLSPIRERPEDAKLLVDHFLARFAREQEKTITMTPELREELAAYSWPGNVREIRLVVERLVALTADGVELRRLPFALEGAPRPRSLPEALEAEERRRVLDALHSHNWNKQRAANALGTSRTTLIAKMQRMGIAIKKP